MTTALVRVPEITYKRGAWIDRFGHRHPAKRVRRKGYTKSVKRARGRTRRTPPSGRWYHPKVHMGWRKDMPTSERRELALDAHDGDLLATARALQALSNVTTDAETKRLAGVDAQYFFREYRKGK